MDGQKIFKNEARVSNHEENFDLLGDGRLGLRWCYGGRKSSLASLDCI